MNDKIIRLRVVVQRNGLPDNKFMLPVSLEDDPTIAKLLEQINSTYFPIESDQWGLEDYSVYRQAPDGSKFECLHFSTIQSIFRDDDQALIRPLQTDDIRRRRISGRYQISSDGKHLVDGIPFGRPLLRVPVSRPPVYIPPRKRRRLIYGQDESAGQDDEDGDGEDTHMLLLTNGQGRLQDEDEEEEEDEDDDYNDNRDGDDFQDDAQQSTSIEADDDPTEDDSEMDADEDLAGELQGLAEENAELGERDQEEQAPIEKPQKGQNLDLETSDKISVLQFAFPSAPLAICEKILLASDDDLMKAYTTLSDGFLPELSDSATLAKFHSGPAKSSPRRRRKTAANATALTVAKDKEKIQDSNNDKNLSGDEEEEAEEVSSFVRQFDHRGLPPGSISSGKGLSHMATISGSFTSSKFSGDSEATSTTLVDSNGSKPSPEKTVGEDEDETSSSGTSSSSEDGESEGNDDDSDDSDGNDSSDEGSDDGVDFFGGDSDSDSSDANGSDSGDEGAQADSSSNAGMDMVEFRGSHKRSHDSDDHNDGESDSASDSGPEEATTKGGTLNKSQTRVKDTNGAQLSKAATSEDSSDSSPDDSSSDDDTSDEESSEAESSSNDSSSDSDSDENPQEKSPAPVASKQTSTITPTTSSTSTSASQAAATNAVKTQLTSVPPGQGKERTKSRNARRRASQKAKKQEQAQLQAGTAQTNIQNTSDDPVPTPSAADKGATDEQLLFEAKRKALLDALASGGVEVDSKGEMISEDNATSDTQASSKRKRDEVEVPVTQDQTPQDASISEPGTAESDASQKRRRLDVGAGRRLLFGALGLRNPKGKDDAEKVRAKLMEGVRPLTNHRLEQEKSGPKQSDVSVIEPAEEEDPEAWRDLITYRAVECCQEGVELSEPPFPFVQRWDPQQQGSWFHKNSDKNGGRGKRAERNQAHFYQEDRSSRKKRKHDESFEWGGEGYDETFNGIEDEPHGGDDVQLNYDDVVEPDQEMNDTTAEVSQFTDLDDLPSLPSNLSSLPILRPGEVKPGMVITWKKWSCSATTSWQPQLSDVTGVVVRIDDDATGVEVCLAKRDRDLDGNQKRYDPVTGKRVYDKFEAPDLDEDDGAAEDEDEGYRTLSFAEMLEPKILQQPFLFVEGDKPAETTSPNHPSESDVPKVPEKSNEEVSAEPEAESHVTESSLPVVGDNGDVDIDASVISPAPATEPAKEEEVRNASNSTDNQPGQGQDEADLSMSDLSGISSPSRQLHETTSQAIDATFHDPSAVESSGYKGDVDTEAIDTTAPLLSDPVDLQEQSSAPIFGTDDEVITGTPKVTYAKMTAPSSVSSVRSGRQLDYTMDEDDNGPDSLRVTEADDEVHGVSTILGADDNSQHEEEEEQEDITTPTPSPTKLFSSDQVTPLKAREQSSRAPSTPGSLASINTIFCTARTSRQTQSPLKSQSQIENTPGDPITKTKKDLDYEEAMRMLDEQSVDEQDEEESSKVPDSFRPIVDNDDSQISVDAVIKDEQLSLPKLRRQPTSTETKISPPPPKRPTRKPLEDRRKEASSSQFSLPPGTQVIDLLSSSDAEQEPEPQFTEDYADEEVDETYSPRVKSSSSLPKGPGWIKKPALDRTRNARSSTAPFGSRQVGSKGLSASQSRSQSQSQSQSRWSTSNSPPSSSLPADLGRKGPGVSGKARRKTSARF